MVEVARSFLKNGAILIGVDEIDDSSQLFK